MMKKFKVEYINENTILFNDEEYLHSLEVIPMNSRLIFIAKEYVIKVDNWTKEGKLNYWKQSWKEWQNYHKFKKTQYKNNFVPVLQSGKINNHWYVIQPKVEIVKVSEHSNYIEDRAAEISKFFDLCDIYEYNYIVKNNDILIYDYAY